MATIRKVKRKTGIAYVAIIKRQGQALKSKTFTRKVDAKEWVARIEGNKEEMESLGLRAGCATFAELGDEYMMQWEGKSFITQQARAAYWIRVFGRFKLSDVTANHIRDELKTLAGGNALRSDGRGKSKGRLKEVARPWSNATINRYRSTLSSIFSYAIREGYLHVNPVGKVPSRRIGKQRTRFLSELERQRLLAACKESTWPKLHLAVLMAMTTGMRRSEMFNLRWCDVDFDRGLAMLSDTKNGESRHCPIPDFVMAEFTPIRQVGNGLLFPSDLKPGQPFELKKHWFKALEVAGIQDFRWHDLRHTAASMLVQNGATLYECGEVLGHKSLETTKRYAHLSTGHKSELVNRIMSGAVKL
jgi:integrase